MEDFKALHNNIKIVDVAQIEKFWRNKKYPLTLGIKAATKDYLVLTDADCKPLSNQWLNSLTSQFSSDKTIVLGYGAYETQPNRFLNKLIRFETFLLQFNIFLTQKWDNLIWELAEI